MSWELNDCQPKSDQILPTKPIVNFVEALICNLGLGLTKEILILTTNSIEISLG